MTVGKHDAKWAYQSFAIKKDWATLLHLVTIASCYLLQITLLSNYLLPIISVLAKNTLLKIACHFLLLLVGFDTLLIERTTIDILVGHHCGTSARPGASPLLHQPTPEAPASPCRAVASPRLDQRLLHRFTNLLRGLQPHPADLLRHLDST
jgi:hypothetical protein